MCSHELDVCFHNYLYEGQILFEVVISVSMILVEGLNTM